MSKRCLKTEFNGEKCRRDCRNDPKIGQSDLGLFAGPSASFGCITLRQSHLVQIFG